MVGFLLIKGISGFPIIVLLSMMTEKGSQGVLCDHLSQTIWKQTTVTLIKRITEWQRNTQKNLSSQINDKLSEMI